MVRMPLEPSFVAIGGLVLAVLVAAVVGGRIGRLVGDRLARRSSAAAVGRLGATLPPPSPESRPAVNTAPWIPVTLITRERQTDTPERDGNPFPGVVGSGAFAHTPPPIISIPRTALSPAMQDRAGRPGAPMTGAAVATPAAVAIVARPPRRRARRLGIAASGLGAAVVVASLVVAGVRPPWSQGRSAAVAGLGDGTPAGPPGGGIAFLPGGRPGEASPDASPDSGTGTGTGRSGGSDGPVAATAAPEQQTEPPSDGHGAGAASGGSRTPAPVRSPAPPPTNAPPRSTPTPAPGTPAPTTAPEATPTPAPPTPPPPTPSPVPTATPKAPTVDFTVQVSGLTVQTTNHTRGATSWTWSFGDGTTSSVRSPSHAYAAAGTYTITLTALGGSGSTASHSQVVAVGG